MDRVHLTHKAFERMALVPLTDVGEVARIVYLIVRFFVNTPSLTPTSMQPACTRDRLQAPV